MAQNRLSRSAVPFAVVAICTIALFGAYLRLVSTAPLPTDEWWLGIARVAPGSPAFAVAMFFATVGASVGVATMGSIAVVFLFFLRRRRAAGMVATTLLLGIACSELVKNLVMRPRPATALYDAHGYSYPSGHSMGAAALACSIALVVMTAGSVTKRTQGITWAIAILWTLLMMWSRTALQVHWLSDTIAGALLGFAVALVMLRVWKPQLDGVRGRRDYAAVPTQR